MTQWDLISRQEAINSVCENCEYFNNEKIIQTLKDLPSAQPTLYGYQIDQLAYIARVMEKEGICAVDAARTFNDMKLALRMIIEEVQMQVEESLCKTLK